MEEVAKATLCLINRERGSRGEMPLSANPDLTHAAQGHSEAMSSGNYFDHVSPDGSTPLARMQAAGYLAANGAGYEVAENIAWGSLNEATPAAIVEAWMASQGHRENILDPHFHDSGIGVSANLPASFAAGQQGAIYTQDFGVILRG